MDIKWTTYRIKTVHPFGISRSTHTFYDVVFVYIIDGDIVGRGEAAPPIRYGETKNAVLTQLETKIELLADYDSVAHLIDHLVLHSGGLKSLEAAISMAALDWWTQKNNIPLYSYFDADPSKMPQTSFTIAIGELETIPQKISEAEPYPILKVKLGTSQDKEIIQAIRRVTDKTVRVDANEGWNLETAIEMSFWLADRNVEFIEQPLKADSIEETAILKRKSPIPIIADENSMVSMDIPKIAHAFHGINIKLMKCGTLSEAQKMIRIAREYEMSVMLGCMVESSVGITAAAHLSPLVDYADLDGNLLIGNDPYLGVLVSDGQLKLNDSPGLGVTPIADPEGLL